MPGLFRLSCTCTRSPVSPGHAMSLARTAHDARAARGSAAAGWRGAVQAASVGTAAAPQQAGCLPPGETTKPGLLETTHPSSKRSRAGGRERCTQAARRRCPSSSAGQMARPGSAPQQQAVLSGDPAPRQRHQGSSAPRSAPDTNKGTPGVC